MGGMVKGKSDPYVKIRVAGITFRSHTIKENLNPTWNELYEVKPSFPDTFASVMFDQVVLKLWYLYHSLTIVYPFYFL